MSNGITDSIAEKIVLFNNSSIPVVIMDLDGNFINSNNPFNKKVSNCKIENIHELLDEPALEIWNEYMGITKEKGKFTFFMPLKVNSEIMGTYKMESVYCDCNKTITISLNLKKELKNSIELSYKGAFNTSDSLMILVDETGIVRDVNDMCFMYLNIEKDQFINKPTDYIRNLFPDDNKSTAETLKEIVEKGFAEVLGKYERTPGDIRYYNIVTSHDKQTGHYLTQVTDRTAQINLEEQLEHNNALSSVGQLAASIAHEIRNPMTTLKGFTQLLRISASEESKRYLSVIDDEIERMESILGEMLILSKPSTNKKELISIQSLMSDLVQVIEPKARLAGITIIKKVDLLIKSMIYGDVVKLKQALFNILKNALEAMPSDGLLTIEIKEVGDEVISVSIQDTGKGIKDSQLPQIFRPYFTTRADGTGLGLSFVLKTIENHGGTISVESKIGMGSKFIILFPVAIGYTTANTSTNLSTTTLYD